MRCYVFVLLTIFIAIQSFSYSAAAECIVYEHADFGGSSEQLGADDSADRMRRWNDRISSIDVSRGCRLTVFEHEQFSGDSKTFGGPTGYIGDRWNDRISSMRCNCDYQPSRAAACELYEHANFAGKVYRIDAEVEDANVWHTFNDDVSSVVVPRNCELWVFEHKDFGGQRKPFGPGSYPYVGDQWNDQISSAACRCNISSWR